MLVEEARTQLVDLTLTGLLMAHRHNYSECLREGVRPAAPTMVRQALELFDEDPSRSITVTEMAAAAGCSIRSLQEGFQRYVGCSPTEYLRDVRLKRVHETLTASGAQTSVADVAHSYGFTHLGRFAQAYRQRFGELPSKTLRGGM
jgi:transcriptional regulator GlxA family with amidase domain